MIKFSLTVVVFLIVLYLPGFMLSKHSGGGIIDRLIGSSLLSMSVYSLLGIIAWTVGFKGLKPVAIGTLLVVIIGLTLSHRSTVVDSAEKQVSVKEESNKHFDNWFNLFLYIAVGAITMSCLFLGSLRNLTSIVQFDDNITHISLIKSMLNGGSLSLLSCSVYSDGSVATAPYGLAFYPNGWHILVALSTRITAASIPLAENAANFALGGIAFPLSVLYFLIKAFDKNKRAIPFGVFACFCCYAFPLRMLMVHGAFPNFAAFCLLPTACGLFIRLFDTDSSKINKRLIPIFVLSCIGLAAIHPNAIFSAIVLLVPYVLVNYIPRKFQSQQNRKKKDIAVASVTFCTVVIVFWLFCFYSPLFKDTVSFDWAWSSTITDSLFQLLTLSFLLSNRASYFLATVFCISLLLTFKNAKTRWLTVSFLCTALMYIAGGCAPYLIKHLICGFWYTDPERIQALVTISAIPILAFGIYSIVAIAANTLKKITRTRANIYLPCAAVVITVFIVGIYGEPAKLSSPTGITAIEETTYGLNIQTDNTQVSEYSESEESFMYQASKKIKKGYTVINLPCDGSALTYAINGTDVYYRNYALGTNRTKGSDSKTSQIIRTNLNQYTNNHATKLALKRVKARYVLLLDVGERTTYLEKDGRKIEQSGNSYYCKNSWKGLSIKENTPGFKLIYKQGKCRLYEITEL